MTAPVPDGPHEWIEQLDGVFATLADEHSRHALHYFVTTGDDVAQVDTLVEHATARVDRSRDRDRVACRFHHATLPKLDDLGVVEYDARSRAVRYHPNPELERVLAHVTEAKVEA